MRNYALGFLFLLLIASCKEVKEIECVTHGDHQIPIVALISTQIPSVEAFHIFLSQPDTFTRHYGVTVKDSELFKDPLFWKFIIEKDVRVINASCPNFTTPTIVIPKLEVLHLYPSVPPNNCDLRVFPNLQILSSGSKNTFILPDKVEQINLYLEGDNWPNYVFNCKGLEMLNIRDLNPLYQIDTTTVLKLKEMDSLFINIIGTPLAINAQKGDKKAMENIKYLESELPKIYVSYHDMPH